MDCTCAMVQMIPVGSQDGPQELEYIQKHNNGDVTRTPFMEVRSRPDYSIS